MNTTGLFWGLLGKQESAATLVLGDHAYYIFNDLQGLVRAFSSSWPRITIIKNTSEASGVPTLQKREVLHHQQRSLLALTHQSFNAYGKGPVKENRSIYALLQIFT